jgi:hypothetical protein
MVDFTVTKSKISYSMVHPGLMKWFMLSKQFDAITMIALELCCDLYSQTCQKGRKNNIVVIDIM